MPTTGLGICFGVENLNFANFATGEPGKVKGRDRVGIVEGSCGYRASIRGKFILSRNAGTGRGGRPVVKLSSDPRVAYPKV